MLGPWMNSNRFPFCSIFFAMIVNKPVLSPCHSVGGGAEGFRRKYCLLRQSYESNFEMEVLTNVCLHSRTWTC